MAIKPKKQGVREAYTFEGLHDMLREVHASGMSLRAIAKNLFNGKVSHGTIQRCILGKEPKDLIIRHYLGLPEIVQYEIYRNKDGRFRESPGE